MKYNSKIALILISVFLFGFISCAPKLTKGEAFPRMYKEYPVSILVLPPINESTAADATDYYSTTIAEPLANSGFYVMPIEVINDILKEQGIYETSTFENIPLEKIKNYFGADAVLYTRITKWNTSYYVIGGNVAVSVEFKLVSTKSSKILWKYSGDLVIDTSGDSNSGGLIGAIVMTAVKTATTDYVPIARKANIIALKSIPFGKYHRMHKKDKTSKVVESKKMKKAR